MKPVFNVSLRYGLLAGIVGSALLIGLYYIGRHPFLIPVYMDFRIILFGVFIFFTLREIRDYHQGGILYFWQGLIASFLFTVYYAIISTVALLTFMSAVPSFLSDYINLSIEQLRSLPPEVIKSVGKHVYETNLKLLPETDAVDLGLLYLIQCFLISLFLSIILSVTLRKHPKI